MGYRASIKNINSIGHLINGNICTFFEETISSSEMFHSNMLLLENLIFRTRDRLFMSEEYWDLLHSDLIYTKERWSYIRNHLEYIYDLHHRYASEDSYCPIEKSGEILDYLLIIAGLFSRCKVKAILLPGFDRNNPINHIMMQPNTLARLVEIHPGETSLILQFDSPFEHKSVPLLNIFPNFEKALYEINNWPGVFLWNDNESIFLPVSQEYDLDCIFKLIKYEKTLRKVKEIFTRKIHKKKYAYLFHMSDLHFGNQIAEQRQMRVIRILEEYICKLEDGACFIPIISGDIMDSPNYRNEHKYNQFKELLGYNGLNNPVCVLGNHDVDIKGILSFLRRQKAVISSIQKNSRIQLFEELKLAIIKIDSTVGGNLAQGKIGMDQLIQIGNEMDAIVDKDTYTFIALLHHHPKSIDEPDWYAKEWYEALFGSMYEKTMKLLDADLFLEWIHRRGIKYVLHGHKHIPYVQQHNEITIIGAGSTTGSVKCKEKDKTCLSFNLIKYDIIERRPVAITICTEEILGAGTKNILAYSID